MLYDADAEMRNPILHLVKLVRITCAFGWKATSWIISKVLHTVEIPLAKFEKYLLEL